MTTMTLTIPDNLAKSLPQCDEATLLEIFKKGLAQYQAEKGLESYLPYLQTDNVIAASHQAKEKSRATIEDQGFTRCFFFNIPGSSFCAQKLEPRIEFIEYHRVPQRISL